MSDPFNLPQDGWYQLSTLGDFKHNPTGLLQVIDDASCKAIVERFAAEAAAPNFPGILIDFDHFSLEKDKPSEAAGWITALDYRPDSGLWAQIRWSDKGEEAVRGGRYRFISPVWRQDECTKLEDGKVRPMHLCNAGLTNDPNIGGAMPLSNAFASDRQRKAFFARMGRVGDPPRGAPAAPAPDQITEAERQARRQQVIERGESAPSFTLDDATIDAMIRQDRERARAAAANADTTRPAVQAAKVTADAGAAQKAIETIRKMLAERPEPGLGWKTPVTGGRTNLPPIEPKIPRTSKPPPGVPMGKNPPNLELMPTPGKGGKPIHTLPVSGRKGRVVTISDPAWWAAHRQPELSKPGHLSAMPTVRQGAMASLARRQGGMAGMSGLYNRRFLANAGPMSDEQRRAMFARMGREGRLPSSSYQPRDYTPTRDYRARIESLRQSRLAIERQAPAPPAVRDFTITDTRKLRDDLLREGKPLVEVQAQLREAESRNLRVSVEIDKIAQRLRMKYPDARSRKAALAEEIDRIGREDAKAAAAYEKDLARHREKLARVDAQIRAEDIRRTEDWNRSGQREENDFAGVAQRDAEAAIREAVAADKAAAAQRAAAEKAEAAASAKTERDSDPVRLNTREKAERSAYWDAIERGNLALADRLAPGADHEANLAAWDGIRIPDDQIGSAKARTRFNAAAAELRKSAP